MNCLIWNVRGMGNPRTFKALKRVVGKYSPSLVFLMETKTYGNTYDKVKSILEFDGGFFVDSIGKSGGLALMWKEGLDVAVLSYSTGHIDVRIAEENGTNWRFTGFYRDPSSRKDDSWELLRRLCRVNILPWLVGGDFNAILSFNEKAGGSERGRGQILKFRRALEDCRLDDMGNVGPKFTWNNRRDGADNVQERLDRFVATQSFRDLFPLAGVENLGFNNSDHRAVLFKSV